MNKASGCLANVFMMLLVTPFIMGFWVLIASLATIAYLILMSMLGWVFSTFLATFLTDETVELGLIVVSILTAVVVIFTWLYAGFRAIKGIHGFYAKRVLGNPKQAKKKAYALNQFAMPIEQLPTADTIQEMLSHDGEIPDTAYRSNDD